MSLYHNKKLPIYIMVLNRLPYLIPDTKTMVQVSVVSSTLTSFELVGDYSYSLLHELVVVNNATFTVTDVVVSNNNSIVTVNGTLPSPFTVVEFEHRVPDEHQYTLVSSIIYGYMVQLEPCFNIATNGVIGVEFFYSEIQKMILADLTAYQLLYLKALENVAGSSAGNGISSNSTTPTTTWLKKAKADVVESEFGIVTNNSNSLTLNAKELMLKYLSDASRLAKHYKCIIDMCNDCTINVRRVFNKGTFIIDKFC